MCVTEYLIKTKVCYVSYNCRHNFSREEFLSFCQSLNWVNNPIPLPLPHPKLGNHCSLEINKEEILAELEKGPLFKLCYFMRNGKIYFFLPNPTSQPRVIPQSNTMFLLKMQLSPRVIIFARHT